MAKLPNCALQARLRMRPMVALAVAPALRSRTSKETTESSKKDDDGSGGNDTTQESPPPAAESPMKTLKIAYLSLLIDSLGLTIAIPVIPYFIRRLGASDTTHGLLFSTYALASAMSQVITGTVADRVGRRPMLCFSMFGSALGFVLMGLTKPVADALDVDAIAVLFVMRAIHGASGNSSPICAAMVADCTRSLPPKEAARFYGLMGAVVGISFTIGPAIGAAVLQIVAAVVGDGDDKNDVTLFAMVMYFSGLVCLVAFVFGLLKLPETLAPVKVDEARPKYSIRDMAGSPMSALIACTFFRQLAFNVITLTLGLVLLDVYIDDDRDASTVTGVVLLFSGLILAGLQGVVFKRAVAKAGPVHPTAIGYAMLGTGLLLSGLAATFELHIAFYLVSVVLVIIPGLAMAMAGERLLISLWVSKCWQGSAQGLAGASQSVSLVLGPAIAGFLYDRKLIYAYGAGAVIGVLGVVAVYVARSLYVAPVAEAERTGRGDSSDSSFPDSECEKQHSPPEAKASTVAEAGPSMEADADGDGSLHV
eukprot:NODE_5027_length_1818_cov_6.299823.p1 GENE.NODE_5027_length_1818_cov_6.299823~~NODE_5027_length_1818_cov_6.299823.p1  ORF type:complete len:536 (+),score=121.26 NODE_5027_length_1818_cov_6.299823:100-1707(+)